MTISPPVVPINFHHSKYFRVGNTRLPRTSNLARGNTHFPRTWCLARGKHPHSAHLSPARSQHPRQPQGFGSLPTSRPGIRKLPTRQSMSSLWSPYHFILCTQLGRVSPSGYEVPPPHSGPSSVYSTDFHPFRITLYLSNPITIYQDIWVSGYSPDDSHSIALSQNNNTSAPFKNTRETDYLSVSPQGSPPVRRESPATTRGR